MISNMCIRISSLIQVIPGVLAMAPFLAGQEQAGGLPQFKWRKRLGG